MAFTDAQPGYRGRTRKPAPNPLQERAEMLADVAYERALKMVELITEDVPVDAEPLDAQEQWMLLEGVALQLPSLWMWPSQAIAELVKLREQFAPGRFDADNEEARIIAEYNARQERLLPDPTMSPASPGWDKYARSHGIRED